MKSRNFSRFSVVAGLISLWCFCRAVDAADFREFSADMVSRAGGQTMRAKLYVSGDKMRTEMPESVVITRLDKNVSWVVMPSEKMYMEQAIDPGVVPQTSREFQGEAGRVSLGRDVVDGQNCEKFEVTTTEGAARQTVYQWVTDSGFPIKMEAADGSWGVEYTNLSVAPQADALFEPPSDFQKLSMPSGVGSGSMSLNDIMSQVGAE